MACRYCGRDDEKMVAAHVIPEGFYRRLREDGSGPRMLTSEPGTHPKRASTGAYDTDVLCEKCEPRFGRWDEYAQRLLREDASGWTKATAETKVIAYEGGDYDYPLLKLFFLSVLWRASVSSHVMFKRVKLGRHESRVLEMLKADAPGDSDTYAVVVAKFVEPRTRAILDPYMTKIDGRNYCGILLGSFHGFVKVDSGPSSPALRPVQLAPDRGLVVIGRDLEGSSELSILRKIANAPHNRPRGR